MVTEIYEDSKPPLRHVGQHLQDIEHLYDEVILGIQFCDITILRRHGELRLATPQQVCQTLETPNRFLKDSTSTVNTYGNLLSLLIISFSTKRVRREKKAVVKYTRDDCAEASEILDTDGEEGLLHINMI